MNNSIQYADYNSFVETIQSSSHENTYQEMIGKEKNVLDTMNNVIKYYRDSTFKEKNFINQPIHYIVFRLFTVWNEILSDLLKIEKSKTISLKQIFTKDDRLVYIGISFVLLSGLLFYIEITSKTEAK